MITGIKKQLRGAVKAGFHSMHEAGSRCGLIVLPKHYYTSFPDLRELRRTRSSWATRSEMTGVAVDLDAQVDFLDRFVHPFESEYRGNTAYLTATSGAFGPGFGYVEAQALHGFIRGTKPSRVIEVGSGVSTFCMLQAAERNAAEGAPMRITCVEPYPSEWLRDAEVQLVEERVERVDLAVFDELGDGDLLFIDSTHALRVGGDVLRIVTEVLPRLKAGVRVHFHDIYFPYDFQRDADRSLFQWLETALLHAYLVDNQRMSISFCLSHLHYDRPDQLKRVFPEYRPQVGEGGLSLPDAPDGHFPSSLYMQVTG